MRRLGTRRLFRFTNTQLNSTRISHSHIRGYKLHTPTLGNQLLLPAMPKKRTTSAITPVTYSPYRWTGLYPAFVRGEAYLAAHQGSEAVVEFQKILDHRGIVLNSPIGALAILQLGRAYAMQGDTAKAKAAYQDFLTLWKDADPDIPILKQSKAEYVKLQ